MIRRMMSFCIRCLQFGFVPRHGFKDGTADIGIYGLSCIFNMGLQNILFVMGQPNLKLVSAYCNGSSAAHVSLDHNCAESTVHRALNRVREYLRMRDYDDLWRILIDHIMEHSPDWGECEPEGILDMIYETYREFNVMDDAQTKAGFKELYRLLDHLTLREQDPVFYAVCDLCHAHQRTGFTEGIKIGIRLGEELRA